MNDHDRARRVGLNEALFREINERLKTLAEQSSVPHRSLDIVCECGDRECAERITLPMEDYTELRSDPLHFAVLPGHEILRVEDVVRQSSTWLTVRKRAGAAAAIARATGD